MFFSLNTIIQSMRAKWVRKELKRNREKEKTSVSEWEIKTVRQWQRRAAKEWKMSLLVSRCAAVFVAYIILSFCVQNNFYIKYQSNVINTNGMCMCVDGYDCVGARTERTVNVLNGGISLLQRLKACMSHKYNYKFIESRHVYVIRFNIAQCFKPTKCTYTNARTHTYTPYTNNCTHTFTVICVAVYASQIIERNEQVFIVIQMRREEEKRVKKKLYTK